MEIFISQLIVSIQAFLPVYLVYRFVVNKEDVKYIVFLGFLVVWFLLLKYEIIIFTPFSLLDYLAWGIYNIGLYSFVLIYNEKTKWSK